MTNHKPQSVDPAAASGVACWSVAKRLFRAKSYGRRQEITMMIQVRRRICAGTWLALAGFSAFSFYDRYWQWRGCFNELGRCYDPESQQVFVEGAGGIWGFLTVVCLALAIISWRRARRLLL